MHNNIAHRLRRAVLALLGVAAILPAAGVQAAPPSTRAAMPGQACSALGTYRVGSRVWPLARHSGKLGAPAPGQPAQPGIPSIAWPGGMWVGTLVISAYSGCGSPTTGTFTVRRVWTGPWMAQPRRGVGIACAVPCWPRSGMAAATGSFVQDPLHPSDPIYVMVTAMVTTTRPGPQLGRPCSVQSGCPAPTVVTSTVSIANVTGYVQVPSAAAGTPPSGTQQAKMATLSFLAPPVAGTSEAPEEVVLQGWRGQPLPLPAPAPQP